MDNASTNITKYSRAFYQEYECDYFSIKSLFLWLYRVIRIALSIIFIWSGASKLLDPASFAVIIEAYGLIPDIMIMPAAILLPFAEVIAGAGLIFDIKGSLTSITIMILLFMAILLYGLWLGFDIDCGCFGPGDPESKAFHGLSNALFRDILLLIGITYLYVYRFIKPLKPREVKRIVNKFKNKRSGCE